MLNSTVLDVAIGVVFAFLGISLITSAVVEGFASALKWRSTTLLEGVKAVVNDPNFTGLAKDLYQHAAINPRGSFTTPKKDMPAYICRKQFASALMDITGLSAAGVGTAPGPAAVAALRVAINTKLGALPDGQMKTLLDGIVQRTNGDITLVQHEIAGWFDGSMDRVGGAYKRHTQIMSFVIALVIAVAMNIDTVHLATALWEQPSLSSVLSSPAMINKVVGTSGDTDTILTQPATMVASLLNANLPIGWTPGHFLELPAQTDKNTGGKTERAASATATSDWVPFFETPVGARSVVGWLLTAIATLFGAPFWFDTLQSFVRLKGAGPSPLEKVDGRAASA